MADSKSSNTYSTVILTVPWFFLKNFFKKSSIWICFTNFIQYHCNWKVDFTIFFFRIFRCIDVILNMWVRVLRWAFRQMSLIQCSWKWFSTIDTVSAGRHFTSTSSSGNSCPSPLSSNVQSSSMVLINFLIFLYYIISSCRS